jgi:hypothetical protein
VYSIAHKATKNVPRLMAAVAASLLTIYIVEAIASSSTSKASSLEGEIPGMVFGVLSTVLFVAAFALEFRKRSIVTSGLLISGGAAMGTLSIARDVLAESGMANIATSFANTASIGYIIMGLGLLHLVKLRESRD